MALGPRGTSSLVMLPGWDATALKNFDLEQNTNFFQIVGDLNSALSAFSAEVSSHPLWGGILSMTDEPDTEYRQGASNGVERYTEYGRGDAKRAPTTGHMLPKKKWDRRLNWTWSYLKEARPSQIDADIRDALDDWRDNLRVEILTRTLKRGDDSGEIDGLGATGLSPGFATAAASTGVDFTPPSFGGTAFTSNHEHYVGIAGGAFTNAVFTDAREELKEHGHEGPYEMLIGTADQTTVEGLSGFTKAAESTVNYGTNTDLAVVNRSMDTVGTNYIGTHSEFNIRVVRGMPQYYGFGYKSYGSGSMRNPLKMRLEKGLTNFTVIQMPDPNASGNGFYPIQETMMYTEFGIGVADRTNGTARYVNNATWADGTPT